MGPFTRSVKSISALENEDINMEYIAYAKQFIEDELNPEEESTEESFTEEATEAE